MSSTGSRNKALTYVLLVILIALWAMVLLPPYIKDRRASGRSFRSGGSSLPGGLPGGLPSASNSAQRFLPLQQASGPRSSGLGSSVDLRGSGRSPIVARRQAPNLHASALPSSNVVHLRPINAPTAPAAAEPRRAPATSAAEYLADTPADAPDLNAMSPQERAMHEAFDAPTAAGLRMPSSTAAARERRRQILLGLTGLAVATLAMAYFSGGLWIAAHVFVDIVMLGYVILLVRHRQLAADRMLKVEPIRPPVTEQAPATLQAAPAYLVRSNTGS